jgi:hypothetical protein
MDAAIKCKTCDAGTLQPRKKYRMSGIVVFIGYILLIPSIMGILFGVIGLFGAGSAGSAGMQTARAVADSSLRTAQVPAPVIAKLVQFKPLTATDTASLPASQRRAVRNASLSFSASTAGTGIGTGLVAGFSMFMIVGSLVGGLLGWLLIMKKRVLQCDRCGAVIATS